MSTQSLEEVAQLQSLFYRSGFKYDFFGLIPISAEFLDSLAI